MKKIALISLNDHVPWGGSEEMWSELALRLIKRNEFEIAISPWRWEPSPDAISKLLDLGARDYRRVYNKYLIFLHRILVKFLTRIFGNTPQFGTYDILFKFQPNLVVISLGDHNLSHDWTWYCRKLKIPYVLIVQLVKDASYPPSDSDHYYDLREGYRNAEMVLCTSYDNKFLLEKQFAYDMANAIVVNNPIKQPEPRPEFPRSQSATMAMVASLNPNHKGHDILLDVLRSEKWRNRDLHINLYGTGMDEKLLKELVQFWELDNVTFHGYADIADIWANNQILVMPSRMEGLSLAFLEAMNCERPVISTNLGDASRFIEDGVNGFLLAAPDAHLLDDAMERAWNKRHEWEGMGKLARERLWQEINEHPISQVEELVLKLLD